MASPHQTLAEAVKTRCAAWGSLPAGMTVERVYSVQKAIGQLPANVPGAICVLVSEVDSQRADRSSDEDRYTVGVVYMAKLADVEIATIDAQDVLLESLRTWLRGLDNVDLGNSRTGRRVRTALPVPFDGDYVNEHELFIAVITCEFWAPLPEV